MLVKNIVITGATSGIGQETAQQLLDQGHSIFFLARNKAKAEQTAATLKRTSGNESVDYVIADLASLATVREAVKEILKKWNRIDVLINNAGGIISERKESADGLELQFSMNHLGHFALTQGLLQVLKHSKARIINVSSEAHRAGNLNLEDLQLTSGYTAFKAYANAKLCNILFTRELARRYGSEGITSYALHPGIVNSSFASPLKGFFKVVFQVIKPIMISSAKGAETSVYLATEPGVEEQSGSYFKKKKAAQPAAGALDDALALKLWEASEALLAAHK